MALNYSILIPTHNRQEILAKTLQSLRQVIVPAGVSVELVVVANACEDDTVALVTSAAGGMPFPTRVVEEPTRGVSHARNRCLVEAQGEILAYLDDDVWVDPHWIAEMLKVYAQYPADFVGGRVDLWWEAVTAPPWFAADMHWALSECDFGDGVFESTDGRGLISANFSFKRKVYEKLGLFDVRLGRVGRSLAAGEDPDYVLRAIRAGFHTYYSGGPRVKHWVAPHRITPEYMVAAQAGTSEARILLKPAFGPVAAVRSIAGHLYLVARHTAGLASARWRGDMEEQIRHRLGRAAGVGGLAGIKRRLTGHVPR